MADKPKSSQVKLGTQKGELVRFSYAHLDKPHLNPNNKRLEYGVTLWIPKTNLIDHTALKAAEAEQLALYKTADGDPGREFSWPIKDGDTLTDSKGKPRPVPGHWVVSAKTLAVKEDGTPNDPPGVVGIERDASGMLKALPPGKLKSGDWGRASINLTFFTKGKGGIGAYLNSVQKVRDGDPLGSRKSAAEEFDDYDDEEEDPLD